VTSNHDVERADWSPVRRQLCADLPGVLGCGEIKLEELETIEQALYNLEVVPDGLRFVSAAEKLHRRDARCTHLSIMRLEAPASQLWFSLYRVHQDIRIQHVPQHQSAARSWTTGCLRSSIKS
jgi:hypothetical protein